VPTLEIVPLAVLGWDFRVEAPGAAPTTLRLSRFRDRGSFTLDGSAYTVARQGLFRPSFTLERGGLVVARAETRGWIRRSYLVSAGERHVEMRRLGWFGGFAVEQGHTHLGEMRRRSLFRRAAVAELDDRIEPHVRLFLVFLALADWRHQARRHR
jgi:hypothetical protein